MNVLYVNHTGVVSGGERSLLALLGALPGEVRPLLATPPGELMTAAAQLGVSTTPIRGTAGSLRLHPLHTPMALAELSLAAIQIRRAAARHRAALVHANSIRAGLELSLARVPVASIVHARDCLPRSRTSAITMRAIASGATLVLANSHYTADRVRAIAPRATLQVLYNAVDLRRFDPQSVDRAHARAELGAAGGRLLLGVVAQLTPWKGQDTAIEALGMLVEQGVDAHLLLIGSAKFVSAATRHDNHAYVASLHARSIAAGLQDRISWLGEREDVPRLMRALDVLLMPSWEEPFGRSLIEAMALEVPVVSTNVGGPPEILEHGREGYLLPPGEPRAWARAIGELASDPARAQRMGAAGRRRVIEAFTLERHVSELSAAYEAALKAAPRAPPRPLEGDASGP